MLDGKMPAEGEVVKGTTKKMSLQTEELAL